ncbi:MAG: formate dehydrogenase accessory sulfurtransferase FdhD [Spirochaetes bacterium]|nr:formate dehydrogenase accessory sulfurtransferase FdhD [Spirochaetota bacterium]
MPADAMPDPRSFPLAEEKAVALEVNGTVIATLMCTPRDLDVLALGHLLTSGFISSLGEVLSLVISPDSTRVSVQCSSCTASGTRPLPNLLRGETFPLASISGWARQMLDRAALRKETGGMHSAGLADRNGLRWFYEDVGRHNAVDKVIGRGLRERVDFSRCCLICSGRIAVEMATKTIAAGIPVFASRSIPTTAAYEMAVEKGLTMIGRCSSPSPVVYTMRERVT